MFKQLKNKTHLLMILLLVIWTADALIISTAVESMDQIFLLCFKTISSLPVLIIFMIRKNGFILPHFKDLPILILAAILGEILYFYCEYTALKYLPVGIVTVLIGLMPAFSYLTDCFIRKQQLHPTILISILFSLIGIILVVWDGNTNSDHPFLGYLSCLGCIVIWIVYGFVLSKLNNIYDTTSITLFESIFACILMLPFALMTIPDSIAWHDIFVSIIIMGILSTGFGYLIEVKGLVELGTTISGIYVNFLPVCTMISGVAFLNESITLLQGIGSALVIIGGLYVIIYSNKADY